VQIDDRAGPELLGDGREHLLGRILIPVGGPRVRADRLTEAELQRDGFDVRARLEVRRPEVHRARTDNGLDRSARRVELRMDRRAVEDAQLRMGVRVIRHFVPLGNAPPKRLFPPLDRDTADEERRPCAARAEQVEDLLGPEGRAVVERKRDERRADLTAVDHRLALGESR